MNEIDISVKAVKKTFLLNGEDVSALDLVNLEVERGQLLCIVGPSGCGKTTLLRIMLGLEQASSGSVWLDPEQVKKGISYVQQSAMLLPWRTTLQNAGLGLELRGKLNAAKTEYLDELVTRYGLGGFEDSLPGELSGGMRQRVAVIRALASKPRLLFCDEPFSAVDFVTRLELNTVFKFMCTVAGITTVFVTHNIEEAIFLGDVVLVMSDRPGRIVATYRPALSVGSEDAVKCRESPEFAVLFREIWSDLKERHATPTESVDS